MRLLTPSLALILACGDGLEPPPDAAAPDAEDRGLGLVSVRVVGDGELGGHLVLFQARDSALLLATRTDPGGRVSGWTLPGGYVSVVVGNRTMTYADVPVGSELVFVERSDTDAAMSVRIKVPPHPEALSYRLLSTCGARDILGAHLVPIDVSLGACGEVADFLAVAVGSVRSRYIFRGGVALDPSSTIEFEEPYQPAAAATITAFGVPPSISVLAGAQTLVRGADEVFPAAMTALVNIEGVATGQLGMPVPPEATMLTSLSTQVTGDEIGARRVMVWGPAADAVTIPFGGGVRRYTEPPSLVGSVVRWAEAADGEIAEGVLLTLSWIDAELMPHEWVLLAPRGAAPELALPTLPLPALVPVEATTAVLRLDSFRTDGGYARARRAIQLGHPLPRTGWFTDDAPGRVEIYGLD